MSTKANLHKWERLLAVTSGIWAIALSGACAYGFFEIKGLVFILVALPLFAAFVLSFSWGLSILLLGLFPKREFEVQRFMDFIVRS